MSKDDDDPIFDGEGPSPGPDLELDEAAELALGEALRSAWAPAPLDPARHRELLELALVDPFAPATADEARESERLRQALEAGDERHAGVALFHALSAATRPEVPTPEASERARANLAQARRPATNVVFVSFGAVALAAAAAFTLFVGGTASAPTAKVERLVPSRSTADLFQAQFEQGKTTDRIDRIASSREHDLRENRYARWGVR